MNHNTSSAAKQMQSPGRLRRLQKSLPTDHLDYCNISRRLAETDKPGRASVTIYENDMVVKVPGASAAPGRKRGAIKTFSDGSQNRMVKFLNRLHWPDGKCYFTGLTFPDEFPDYQTATRQMETLFKRIKRRWPDFEYLWRKEFKPRLSGKNKGKIAPHFHVFMWGITIPLGDFFAWLRITWTDIAGNADVAKHLEHGCDVKEVFDRKCAVKYISKYMTKMEGEELEVAGSGRHWGNSRGLDTAPIQETVISRATLAIYKMLLVRWLLQQGRAFWMKLIGYPAEQGFHVYGLGIQEARELLAEAVRLTEVERAVPRATLEIEIFGGYTYEQARTAILGQVPAF